MLRAITIFLCSAMMLLASSDFKVGVEVSAKKLGKKDLLIYTVTLSGDGRAKAPSVSHIKDFAIIQTSNSQSFQFINGAATYEIKYTYYLKPLRLGKLSIPPLKYKFRNKSYKTEGFVIQVVRGSVKQKQKRPQRPLDSLFNDSFGPGSRRASDFKKKDVFVKTEVSRKKLLVGEQFVCKVKLFSLRRVYDISLLSGQTFPGFWFEWFPGKRTITGSQELIDGKAYRVFEISKVILFPAKDGILEVPPFKYEILVSSGTGMSFFDRQIKVERETKRVKIDVAPLPEEATGMPVGSFKIKLLPVKKSIDVNDILTLKFRLSGVGNIKTLTVPTLKKSDIYRVYPPKINRNSSFKGDVVSGSVTSEIPVSFNKTGEHKIPSLAFGYYDKKKGRIVNIRTPESKVEVTGKKDLEADTGGVQLMNRDIKRKAEDIRFIVKGKAEIGTSRFYKNSLFAWLIIVPFLVTLLLIIKLYIMDPKLSGSRKPGQRIYKDTLSRLGNCEDSGEICSILDQYISVKTGTGHSDINTEFIDSIFEKSGVGSQDSRRFIDIRRESESSRYAGSSYKGSEMGRLIEEIVEIVGRINRKLK